jgi:outer membrane immunogenic protein
MGKLLVSGISLLTAMMVAAPAFADEAPAAPRKRAARPAQQQQQQPQQPQRQASNWNGGQLGSSNGGSSVNNNFVEPGAYVCPADFEFGVHCFETPLAFSGKKTVYTSGFYLGYNWQWGAAVVGWMADIYWKKAETTGTVSSTTCFDVQCFIYRTDHKQGSIEQKWDASVVARGGILVTPWTLVYLVGGVAFGRIEGSLAYQGHIFGGPSDGSFATANGSWSDTRTGYTFGAGIETDLGPIFGYAGLLGGNWKARIEYRLVDFGSYAKTLPVNTHCAGAGCSAPSSSVLTHVDASFDRITFGLARDLWY